MNTPASARRVAAIYDVHGNLPALDAVLGALDDEEVDLLIVGGDVVPGPMSSECLERLRGLAVPTLFLRGNGENDLLAAHRGESLARVPTPVHAVMRWVERQLSPAQFAAMDAWPATLSVPIEGIGSVLFCHATPGSDVQIFTARTPASALRPLFADVDEETVVCGHTRMQFDRRVGDVRVLNAGSVGLPFGDPAAAWLLLTPQGIEARRTDYDLEAAQRRLAQTGYPRLETFDVRRPPAAAEMLDRFDAFAPRADD